MLKEEKPQKVDYFGHFIKESKNKLIYLSIILLSKIKVDLFYYDYLLTLRQSILWKEIHKIYKIIP